MSEPKTRAGRALRVGLEWTADVVRHDDAYLPDILAIEDEAVAAERARIRAAVEAAWTTHGAISQAVVLRCVDGADR